MKKLTASILLSLFPYCTFAGVFQADITVANSATDTQRKPFDFDDAESFFDQLTRNGISQEFSNYNDNSTVTATTDYQGVEIRLELEQNSDNLILRIPELNNFTKTFTGKNRSDSTSQLKTYLKNDTDGLYSRIVEYQAANTPTSQVAGNPTSLQGQLVGSTFDYAANANSVSTSSASGGSSSSGSSSGSSSSGSSSSGGGKNASKSSSRTGGAAANPLMVGVGGGTYTQKGIDVAVISVPISKAFGVDSDDPRKKFLLNGQFNYITVAQAASFQGSLGMGYMHPLTDNWYLIPSVSYGAIGSQDLASLGQIFSASISSNYQFKLPGVDMGFVNMFGYYKTLPLSIGGVVSSDPNIQNYVFKNGIFPSKVVPFLFGHDVRVKGIFTDTEFTGSKVFVRQYNEVGIELSSVKKVGWLDKATFGLADALSLSGKYVFSIQDPNNFEGYDIGISYDF